MGKRARSHSYADGAIDASMCERPSHFTEQPLEIYRLRDDDGVLRNARRVWIASDDEEGNVRTAGARLRSQPRAGVDGQRIVAENKSVLPCAQQMNGFLRGREGIHRIAFITERELEEQTEVRVVFDQQHPFPVRRDVA